MLKWTPNEGHKWLCFQRLLYRCCEKTLEVLRQNQESVLTILQVLLYDPLYAWTMSPQKAYMLQHARAEPDMSEMNTTTGDLLDYAGQTSKLFHLFTNKKV